MKTRTKKILLIVLIPLCVLIGVGATWLWYEIKYDHRHCIVQVGLAFPIYSSEHFGQLPFSTNGFGDALLKLLKEDPTVINSICGPDDDGHLFKEALENNSIVPEEKSSSRISRLPSPIIQASRNGCPHGERPWSPPLQELRSNKMQICESFDSLNPWT